MNDSIELFNERFNNTFIDVIVNTEGLRNDYSNVVIIFIANLFLQNKTTSEAPVTGSDPGISSDSASDIEDGDNDVSN